MINHDITQKNTINTRVIMGGLSSQYESYDEALYGDNSDDAHDGKHTDI